MALNPGIILSGRQPDLVNALVQGTQAAAMQGDTLHMQGYRNALLEHGPGAFQGDQQARAMLAQYDPQAMQGMAQADLGMEATRLGMEQTRQQMRILDENARRQAAEMMRAQGQAATMAEVEASNRVLQGALMTPDPQTWDAFVMAQGAPELVGQFDNRQALAAMAMDMSDVAGMVFAQPAEEPASFTALRMRAAEAGLQPGTPEYQAFMAQGGAESNQMTVYDPATGRPILTQGTGNAARPFTEAQSKDNVFFARASGALQALEPVADALASRGERLAEGVPLGLGRELQSEDFQVALNAGNEFLQAILRKDTGAAITAQEQVLYGETYLPQPGDGPAVLEAKRQARARALAAIEAGMSPDQILAAGQALVSSAQTPAAPPAAAAPVRDFSTMSAAELSAVDLGSMSLEELDAFMAALDAIEAARGGN